MTDVAEENDDVDEDVTAAAPAPPLPALPPPGCGRLKLRSLKPRVRAGVFSPGENKAIEVDVTFAQYRRILADPVLAVDVVVEPPAPVAPHEIAGFLEAASLRTLETRTARTLGEISKLEAQLKAKHAKIAGYVSQAQLAHDQARGLALSVGLDPPDSMRVPDGAAELLQLLARFRAGEIETAECWTATAKAFGTNTLVAERFFEPEQALDLILRGRLDVEVGQLLRAEQAHRKEAELEEAQREAAELAAEAKFREEARELALLEDQRARQQIARQNREHAERERAAEAAERARRVELRNSTHARAIREGVA